MPGRNCAILGCGSCGSNKYKGVSLFKYPGISGNLFGKSDEEQAIWRSGFLNSITKDRVIDENLRNQIESGNLYVCEKHFKSENIIAGECKNF